jgi:hypothetical protein
MVSGQPNSRESGGYVRARRPQKLRSKLRELIESLPEYRRPSIAEIVSEVTRFHSDLVEHEKDRLFKDAISSWARKILSQKAGSSTQLFLPIVGLAENLPRRIALRNGNKKNSIEW